MVIPYLHILLMVTFFCVVPSVIAFFEGFKHDGQHVVTHCLRQIRFSKSIGSNQCTYFQSCLYYINRPINKYKIDIVKQMCVSAFRKCIIYHDPITGSIYLDRVKFGEETAKSAVFKMAGLKKCEAIFFALVLKRSFQQQNKFILKSKVDILIP